MNFSYFRSFLIFSLIHLLSASLAFADYELSKSELLQRIDNGTITMERAPLMRLPDNLYQTVINSQTKEFVGFKEGMFYYGYVNSNKTRYLIFFEWYNRGCVFGKTAQQQPDKKMDGKSFYELSKKEYDSYEKIDKKYCEKILNLKIHNSGGLPKMSVPRSKGDKK